ncbi:hypothetical protein [Bifidobacterium tissieri]|uniref:Uncharacterized protein n=1 Tax=Bifidobacterium tissieri TaxID=1630162 RepID=A0A5M9ZM24_9BIFI|nr:hypothetical protein [Bifidobacterium tissieri]KAA8828651.1 hypothetical protein EM849_11480 [Bifidobacterium tissieri]KAA8831594.1 hypothetical protein EMO89_02395 [Bifidobacterium tissieri]
MGENKTDNSTDNLEDIRKYVTDAFTSLTIASNRLALDGDFSPTLLRDATCGIVTVARLLEHIRWEQIDREDDEDMSEDDE